MCCKKALTAFVAMFLLSNVAAAKGIGAGTTEIGGDLGLGMSSTTVEVEGFKSDTDSTDVSVFVLRYFVPDLGFGIGWNYEATEYTSDFGWYDQSYYEIGPMVAFNVSMNPQTSVKLVGQFGLISSGYQDSTGDTDDADGTFWSGGARLSYFLTDSASLNAIVQYTSRSLDLSDTGGVTMDVTTFQYGLGLSVYLQ